MRAINYDEINYSEIITFLSVAKTLNMSVSADELSITQPAVSKRISKLEKNYGLILFQRKGNGLKLTPAGRVFYEELSGSFKNIETAFSKAYTVQNGIIQNLTIGYDGFFDLPLLYELAEQFRQTHHGVDIDIRYSSNESCDELFEGKADILIRPDACFKNIGAYVKHEPITCYQFCVLVSKKHSLASRQSLTIQDILTEPLIAAHMDSQSPYISTLCELFLQYGSVPKFQKYTQLETLCFYILLNKGIAVASPSFWKGQGMRTIAFFQENIQVFPLDNKFYPVSFVWKADSKNPFVKNFIKLFQHAARKKECQEILWQSYNWTQQTTALSCR